MLEGLPMAFQLFFFHFLLPKDGLIVKILSKPLLAVSFLLDYKIINTGIIGLSSAKIL